MLVFVAHDMFMIYSCAVGDSVREMLGADLEPSPRVQSGALVACPCWRSWLTNGRTGTRLSLWQKCLDRGVSAFHRQVSQRPLNMTDLQVLLLRLIVFLCCLILNLQYLSIIHVLELGINFNYRRFKCRYHIARF